jgi:hypothetical protein
VSIGMEWRLPYASLYPSYVKKLVAIEMMTHGASQLLTHRGTIKT